jgi:hypothetical protein
MIGNELFTELEMTEALDMLCNNIFINMQNVNGTY